MTGVPRPAWGELGPGGNRSASPAPVPHRPWSTMLLALHVIGMAAGAALVIMGVLAIRQDAAAPSPEDGGPLEAWVFLAGVAASVVGVAVLGVAALLTVQTIRGRREADAGSPDGIRGAALAVLVVMGLGVVVLVAGRDLTPPAPGVLVALVCAVPAGRLLWVTRTGSGAPGAGQADRKGG